MLGGMDAHRRPARGVRRSGGSGAEAAGQRTGARDPLVEGLADDARHRDPALRGDAPEPGMDVSRDHDAGALHGIMTSLMMHYQLAGLLVSCLREGHGGHG